MCVWEANISWTVTKVQNAPETTKKKNVPVGTDNGSNYGTVRVQHGKVCEITYSE